MTALPFAPRPCVKGQRPPACPACVHLTRQGSAFCQGLRYSLEVNIEGNSRLDVCVGSGV